MKTSAVVVLITLCIFCVLFVTVSSASITRRSVALELSREYPELYDALRQQTANDQTEYKRGCASSVAFCAHIGLAKQLYKSRRPQNLFGAGSPGKRSFAANDFQQKKRVGGCDSFGGCASLKAGRDLVRAMLRPSYNQFGASSPGKK